MLGEREHAVSGLLPRIGVGPANTSQHLAVLRRAGLVTTRKVAPPSTVDIGGPGTRRRAAGGFRESVTP
ncbi:ArsR family transcriptional regulator [Amycolatopsis sp. NBC_00355]|uniref:ArsR family transcriptional regulator n=1 Tax=Amycolatopsis sp. NBC_00355 TaxID=2975957 RepID=UPI002E26CD44